MTQQTLFDMPDPQGDNPENIYTPDSLALQLCQILRDEGMQPAIVAELHVGGGAFVRAVRKVWPDAYIVGGDLDPNAAGLDMLDNVMFYGEDLVDYLERNPNLEVHVGGERPDLIIGNPPFDRRLDDPSPASTAFDQWGAINAVSYPPDLCWLMPTDLYSVQRWSEQLLRFPPKVRRPITRRVWPNVRGVDFWHWDWEAEWSAGMHGEQLTTMCVPIHWDGTDRQRKADARTGRVSR